MVRTIPLAGQPSGMVALVDDEDFDLISQYRWRVSHCPRKHAPDAFYARRYFRSNGKQNWQYMHRLIMGCPEDIDHKDGNGLNNQRKNLRPTNDSLNQANRSVTRTDSTSQYRGVTWSRKAGKWQAGLGVNGRFMYLGLFKDEVEAARSYDIAAVEHFGSFARTNFPEEAAA